MPQTCAIILAGGAGTRMGKGMPKQFLPLGGHAIIEWTVALFEHNENVDTIVMVSPPDYMDKIRALVEMRGPNKVSAIVPGGPTRRDSSWNGLTAADFGDGDIVLIHDAARPFAARATIDGCIETAKQFGAAGAYVKAVDTISEISGDEVVAIPPRDSLYYTQTPQAFRYDVLCRAYAEAQRDHFYGTDDASLVERTGVKVRMVTGSHENIKITTPEDLLMAEALMENKRKEKMTVRSGLGYDSHRFSPGRKLILGGVEIPFDHGLQGHSDADVVLHAVCDALLGMAGAGDIGRHFPDTDEAYKNISSLILLERVWQMITANGFSVNNIDVTVMMEKPKLAPYAGAMASNIAGTLHIPEPAVNIKAKTNEGMGFVGRGEGVAVLAIATGMERMKNG